MKRFAEHSSGQPCRNYAAKYCPRDEDTSNRRSVEVAVAQVAMVSVGPLQSRPPKGVSLLNF
jgi:hypothetical protein